MRRLSAMAVLSLCLGCARVSGDAVALGAADTWRLSERLTPLQGGAAAAARTALTRAQAFCRDRGQRAVPLDSQETGWPIQQQITGPTGFTLDFRCARPDSTQLNVGRLDP